MQNERLTKELIQQLERTFCSIGTVDHAGSSWVDDPRYCFYFILFVVLIQIR